MLENENNSIDHINEDLDSYLHTTNMKQRELREQI